MNYSFKDAYRLLQQRTMTVSGQYGPINIYAPDMRALFLLFLASRKPSFKWKDAEAFDKNAALHCALSIKKLQKGHQRRAARRVLDIWLQARGWWTSAFVHVHAPHRSFIPVMRRYIHSAAAHHSNGNALHAAWIRSHFQLVLGRAPLCSVASGAMLRLPKEIPRPVPQLVSSSMMRVERNWRVEERLTSDQELELCLQQVDAVLPKSKHVARSTAGVSSSPGIRRRQQSRRDTQSQYDEYTRAQCARPSHCSR